MNNSAGTPGRGACSKRSFASSRSMVFMSVRQQLGRLSFIGSSRITPAMSQSPSREAVPANVVVNRREVRIEWGDCDPANIVFYPRYFAFFDASTAYLFEAVGL